jgi:hypothetical protein
MKYRFTRVVQRYATSSAIGQGSLSDSTTAAVDRGTGIVVGGWLMGDAPSSKKERNVDQTKSRRIGAKGAPGSRAV